MTAPLAILYEHPRWFEPLFEALDRRGIACRKIDARSLMFDPADPAVPAPLILNRVAMSSPQRNDDHSIFHTMAALDHWRRRGARIVNGLDAMALDASKARQLSLIESLGLSTPPTRVIHRLSELETAALAVGFPLLVKANIGGAGAGIARFETVAELRAAIAAGAVPQSVDRVLLVQRYIEPRAGQIFRVELLGGEFLYAIAISVDGNFDLCPADACLVPGRSVIMTSVRPPAALIAAAEAIAAAAAFDLGSVEYVIDDADGTARFFDINALSNFVANPVAVLGWDPHDRLVDFLERRLNEGDFE